jgi:hypothetical protein
MQNEFDMKCIPYYKHVSIHIHIHSKMISLSEYVKSVMKSRSLLRST